VFGAYTKADMAEIGIGEGFWSIMGASLFWFIRMGATQGNG
jgi:hypothetical protein